MAYVQNLHYDGSMLYRVERNELLTHLQERVAHHIRRNDEILKKAQKIEEEQKAGIDEQETVTDRMAFKSTSNYAGLTSQRESLLTSARTHAQKATTFKFYADHVPAEEAFYLSSVELAALEFVPFGQW